MYNINDKCNICSRYCIYHVKFTSYYKLIECSRPIRFFMASLMYNNDVYRKPAHTDRYLDFSSHHHIKHKISTASTLLFGAFSLPSSHEGKTQEINYVRAALEANGYPSAVTSSILNKKPPLLTVPPPEELVSMFFKWAEPSDTYKGFACLPYISCLTEHLRRLLRNKEIRVVNKQLKTL